MNGKQKIIESAKAIISRNGIAGATMREIAKEAGMSTGAIYHYYKSKEDILYEIMDESLSESYRIDNKLNTNPNTKEEIIDDIYINIMKRFDKMYENKLQFYLAEEAIQGNDELKIKFKNKYEMWVEHTEHLILKLYNAENSEHSKVLASLLIATIDGLVLQLLLNANTANVEDLMEVYHKLLRGGIPKILDYLDK